MNGTIIQETIANIISAGNAGSCGSFFRLGDTLGFITWPYGTNLFVASSISGIPCMRIAVRVLLRELKYPRRAVTRIQRRAA